MTAAAVKAAGELRLLGRRRQELAHRREDLRKKTRSAMLRAYAAGVSVADASQLLGFSREMGYQVLREARAYEMGKAEG